MSNVLMKPHDKTALYASLALIIILLLCRGSILLLKRMEPIPTPLLVVDARTLLLDIQAFPPSWEIFECAPYCLEPRHTTHTVRTFGVPNTPGHVIQEVYRFNTIEAAQDRYTSYKQAAHGTQVNTSSYQSTIADEHYLSCGGDVVPSCQAYFRYRQYMTYFYFNMKDGTDGTGLALPEIEAILRAMDVHAIEVLNLSNSS